MGREEAGHVVVEERQAGGAQALTVGGQVELAGFDRGEELGGAVGAVVELVEVDEPVGVEGGVAGQGLAEVEVGGLARKSPLLEELQGAAPRWYT